MAARLLPTMADLPANLSDEDNEEDEGDEKKLMSLLLKLKTAKKSVDVSRKRKLTKSLADTSLRKYAEENSEIIARFKKKKSLKSAKHLNTLEKLELSIVEATKKVNSIQESRKTIMSSKRNTANKIIRELEEFEAEVIDTIQKKDEILLQDIQAAKNQVKQKLEQLEVSLKKITTEKKEDAFTRMIKNVLSNI